MHNVKSIVGREDLVSTKFVALNPRVLRYLTRHFGKSKSRAFSALTQDTHMKSIMKQDASRRPERCSDRLATGCVVYNILSRLSFRLTTQKTVDYTSKQINGEVPALTPCTIFFYVSHTNMHHVQTNVLYSVLCCPGCSSLSKLRYRFVVTHLSTQPSLALVPVARSPGLLGILGLGTRQPDFGAGLKERVFSGGNFHFNHDICGATLANERIGKQRVNGTALSEM